MIRKLALALAAVAGSAHAAAPVYTSAAYAKMANPSVNAWCSECGGNQQIVDAFTVSSATTLGGADTAIDADYGSNWNVTVSLYDSGFNKIDSATFAWGTYSVKSLGNGIDEAKFTLPGWSVAAGNYYIGFTDFNLGAPGYYVGGSEQQYNLAYKAPIGTSAALQLTSAVPESSNVALLIAGLGVLTVGLRRRRA